MHKLACHACAGLRSRDRSFTLAAATIYSKLLYKTPVGLPLTLRTRSGRQISLNQTTGTVVQNAAAAVNGF